MANVRVFSLARDLNLTSQEVIARLHKLGVEVRTASSSVDEDTADKLRRALKIDALTRKRKRIYGSEEVYLEKAIAPSHYVAVQILADDTKVDYLFFVGCSGAFDSRNRRTALAHRNGIRKAIGQELGKP